MTAHEAPESVDKPETAPFSLRHLQKNLPWTIPYSDEFARSTAYNGLRPVGHDVLHVMKSLGRIAAEVEGADHERPRKLTGDALAKEVADLVICALHIARLEGFDLQDAVVSNSEARNAASIPSEVRPELGERSMDVAQEQRLSVLAARAFPESDDRAQRCLAAIVKALAECAVVPSAKGTIAEPCQRLGCRFDVAQSMLDRAKERGELTEAERTVALSTRGHRPPGILFRPMLMSGCVASGDSDSTYLMIDSEQPEREQLVTFWHEALHYFGMVDEAQVEALAQKMADAAPDVLPALKALERTAPFSARQPIDDCPDLPCPDCGSHGICAPACPSRIP